MILCCGGANAVPIGHTGRIFSFYAVFSKPFTYTLYTDTVQENDKQIPVCKMLLHFETAKDEQVLAKFSISSVDAEGAYKNLQAEMPGWNF